MNSKLLALIVVIIVGASALLVLLLNQPGKSSEVTVPTLNSEEESLQIISAGIWYNPFINSSYSAILLINEKNTTAQIQKITIKGLAVNWANVYYCKTEIGLVSKISPIANELTGTTSEISIDDVTLTLKQATGEILFEGFKALVVYVKNSISIDAQELPEGNATVVVFTQKNAYFKEVTMKPEYSSIDFMPTEELKITRMQFLQEGAGDRYIRIIANNTGTTPVTISAVYLNNKEVNSDDLDFKPVSGTAAANSGLTITITEEWVEGNNYQVKLISSKGNTFVYTAVGPE
ncbi:MAG: hypothetical protein WHU54_02145 [Candidatus Bathyarchaeia archaeon]